MRALPLLPAIKAVPRDAWRDTAMSALYSHVGGLAPFYLGAIIVMALGEDWSLRRFAEGGEFALYSAALLATVFYQILHDRSPTPLPGRTLVGLLALPAILVSIVFYTLLSQRTFGAVTVPDGSVNGIVWSTLILFMFCLVLSVLVGGLEHARQVPPVQALQKSQEQSVFDAFDQLEGG